MKRSFPLAYLRLYAGLTLAVVIILLVVILTVQAIRKQGDGTQMVNHSVKIIEKLRDIRYNLLQMRGARRAFWLTGKNNFLDSYYKGNNLIPNYLQELIQEVSDNPIQTLNVNRLILYYLLYLFFGQPMEKYPPIFQKKNLPV